VRRGAGGTFSIDLVGWCVDLGRLEVVEWWRVVLCEVEALRVARLEQLVEARTLKLERRRVLAKVELRVLRVLKEVQ
jgi:hypothetical protein